MLCFLSLLVFDAETSRHSAEIVRDAQNARAGAVSASPRLKLQDDSFELGLVVEKRNVHLDCRPSANLAFEADGSAQIFNHLLRNGEPKPHAVCLR